MFSVTRGSQLMISACRSRLGSISGGHGGRKGGRKEHRMDVCGRRVGRKSEEGRRVHVGAGKNVGKDNRQQILFEVP